MLNVTNTLKLLTIGAVVGWSMMSTACDSDAKKEKASADSLVTSAQSAFENKQYDEAFALLDTLDKKYPKQIEARREGTKLRSNVMIGYSERQIYLADSIIASLNDKVNSASVRYKHIDGGDIPGYYVLSSAYNPSFMSSNTIEGRVADDSYAFYLVAINSGKPVGINQVAIETTGPVFTSSIIPNSTERAGETDRNGIDLATFTNNEVAEMIEGVAPVTSAVNALKLIGVNGTVAVKYTPKQAAALAETYDFAQMAYALRQAMAQKNKYEQQLIVARDHSANLEY